MSDINETKKLLRSLLISAEHGVALKDLSRDFYDTVGYPLPYKRLGYMSVEDMLEDIPDTVRTSKDYTGQIRLFGVSNQDTEHIADMVKKQKKGTFNPYKPPPKAQGVQQVQRGKRSSKPTYSHNHSFHSPRPGYSRVHARSYSVPQGGYEVDSLSSSSYTDLSKYQRQSSGYYKGSPAFRNASNNYHAKNFNPTYNNLAKPLPPPPVSFNSYNYQHRSPLQNISRPIGGPSYNSDHLSPNKNSHLLHGTKDALSDLLSQNPGGIPGEQLENEYYKIFRTKLPFYELGHRSVKEFMESIPDVVKIDYSGQQPVCFLSNRQEKQTIKSDFINTSWSNVITPESLSPLEVIKPNRGQSPEVKLESINTSLKLETHNGEESGSIILTEEEKKHNLNELRTKIYVFLLNKNSPVPLDEFEHQYRVLNQADPEIAYKILGYPTLKEFLLTLMDILVFLTDNKDGSLSVAVKNKEASPPSPIRPPSDMNSHIRPRFSPHNFFRPVPMTAPIHPIYRTTGPASGFLPPGVPPPNIRPQRRPINNPNFPRFPYHPQPPPPPPLHDNQMFLPPFYEPPLPMHSSHRPSGFDVPLPPSLMPLSPLNDPLLPPFPFPDLISDLSSISFSSEDPPKKPFTASKTKINSLNLDFGRAQHDFVQTQILSIVDTRREIKLKLNSDPVLRFLEGSNVALLAGDDQGKCALMSVALTNGLNMLTDNLQSLIICQDEKGVRKIFECLETISDNTGLRVSSCDSAQKLKTLRTDLHILVLTHSILYDFLKDYDTSQLTRIGIYNLITDFPAYYRFIHTLKLKLSEQLDEMKFFFATSPHNEAGTYILKLINTLMVTKCIFSYYGKDQETCLTLLPHDVENSQIQKESEAALRSRLLASLTSRRKFPNYFDKFLIPLGSSKNNFTILSNHMEEIQLQQSLALIALKKVEPSSHMTQIAIVVPSEQQAKDFQELCEIGQGEAIKSLMVNSKAIKEEMRSAHICIGWPKEISHMANNTGYLSKLTLVILFRIDLEHKFEYLEDLFKNCQSPQIVVVGSNYTRQILKFESQFMSEPKHITFLAKDTY